MSDKDNIIDFAQFKQRREEAKAEITAAKDDESLNKGILGLIDIMEKQDNLIQMLIQDVVTISTEIEKLRMGMANASSSVAAIITALEEKGTISSDEIKKVWERDMLPLLQGKKKPSPILVPKKPDIIIP